MQEKNFIKSALQVIAIEGNAILALQDQIQGTFNDLCEKIINDIDCKKLSAFLLAKEKEILKIKPKIM